MSGSKEETGSKLSFDVNNIILKSKKSIVVEWSK